MAEIRADAHVDITDVVCPVTFVKVKAALAEIDAGKVLEVRLADGEPLQNVPRSCKDEGHKVLRIDDAGDNTYTMFVEKGQE